MTHPDRPFPRPPSPLSRLALFLLLASGVAGQAAAIVPTPPGQGKLASLAHADERLTPPPPPISRPIEKSEAVAPEVQDAWKRLTADQRWQGYVDQRNGRIEAAEGAGLPWLPGRGNQLDAKGRKADLATLERIARDFLETAAPALGVDPAALTLDRASSGHPADYLWNVDFDVRRGELPIDGARVVFRVNNGNLVQFGTENLPAPEVPTPQPRLSRDQARERLARFLGGFGPRDKMLDDGSLHLLPAAPEKGRNAQFAPGRGRELVAVWQFVFLRPEETGTWRARVDAVTGEVRELLDLNQYGQVNGGVFPISPTVGPETTLAMPFADVSSGGFTSSSGSYTFTSGTVTSALNGQYVRINDNCGAISKGSDAGGLIAFGTSSGTDCTTPGSGGTGNTHSARTQFYHVNRSKEAARPWSSNPTMTAWLNAQLQVNVNINLTCNAFWSPGMGNLNFYRSGGGCANTGEIAGVSLHEYGHGLDQNDGNGTSPDRGTGETYGDFTATLATHVSCVGPGFRATSCASYGDACTACTGVRDIDFAQHTSAAAHTVANFTQAHCPSNPFYQGLCGREGHCESYISSEALWDFPQRDLPSPGSAAAWTVANRLWYASRSTATSAFTCNTAGATWTSDGCSAGSYWRTMRLADDDDGNLANGTPHSCALFAAFNRHGVACASDPGANVCFTGCTAPTVPTVTLTPAPGQITVSWTSSGAGVVYDVYRNEAGCTAGFTKIAEDVAGTSFPDNTVANHQSYFYQVVAQPTGNEACAAAPSSCATSTPGVDVWSQDRTTDTGLEPDPATAGLPMWESQDIWVRNDTTNGPHQNPELGQTNVIHVRVRNRGGVAAGPFNVEVYFAAASTGLSWPTQWTLIGTAPVTSLAPGANTEVTVDWNPVGTGHYCLVARLVSTEDPMSATETTNIDYNARNNNNVVWKNVEVVDMVHLAAFTTELLLPNPARRAREYLLRFEEVRPRQLDTKPLLSLVRIDLKVDPKRLRKMNPKGLPTVPFEPTTLRDLKRIYKLSLEPGQVIPLTLILRPMTQGSTKKSQVYLLRVIQVDAQTRQVIGGMTYEIQLPR
jgi:hypothetical protein